MALTQIRGRIGHFMNCCLKKEKANQWQFINYGIRLFLHCKYMANLLEWSLWKYYVKNLSMWTVGFATLSRNLTKQSVAMNTLLWNEFYSLSWSQTMNASQNDPGRNLAFIFSSLLYYILILNYKSTTESKTY